MRTPKFVKILCFMWKPIAGISLLLFVMIGTPLYVYNMPITYTEDNLPATGIYSIPIDIDEQSDYHIVKFENGMQVKFSKNRWHDKYSKSLHMNKEAMKRRIDVSIRSMNGNITHVADID